MDQTLKWIDKRLEKLREKKATLFHETNMVDLRAVGAKILMLKEVKKYIIEHETEDNR